MYAFLDQPVIMLSRGGQMMVWAMRHWTRAVGAGRCPCGDVGPGFLKAKLMPGFPHFHMMMALLNRHALDKLAFADIDCPRISDGEALLLSLIRMAGEDSPEHLASAAALVIQPTAVPPLLMALDSLAGALAQADLWPALPMFDPDNASFPHE
ncbi:MAG: hypothetical protein KKD64_06230 [Alphaproteobacteria bacterium]|nr:hypothetical protein [Alphaproteobacteria bacterium]MBU0792479.1 hypothetical protein [Alphaproteobacteria bacterium]MBU0876535.1 hypothetical protein [Alphaproteobacteria bacterium]MBU1769236.1 hypothetical protein [Alphaproteobacteria bacterium]